VARGVECPAIAEFKSVAQQRLSFRRNRNDPLP